MFRRKKKNDSSSKKYDKMSKKDLISVISKLESQVEDYKQQVSELKASRNTPIVTSSELEATFDTIDARDTNNLLLFNTSNNKESKEEKKSAQEEDGDDDTIGKSMEEVFVMYGICKAFGDDFKNRSQERNSETWQFPEYNKKEQKQRFGEYLKDCGVTQGEADKRTLIHGLFATLLSFFFALTTFFVACNVQYLLWFKTPSLVLFWVPVSL